MLRHSPRRDKPDGAVARSPRIGVGMASLTWPARPSRRQRRWRLPGTAGTQGADHSLTAGLNRARSLF